MKLLKMRNGITVLKSKNERFATTKAPSNYNMHLVLITRCITYSYCYNTCPEENGGPRGEKFTEKTGLDLSRKPYLWFFLLKILSAVSVKLEFVKGQMSERTVSNETPERPSLVIKKSTKAKEAETKTTPPPVLLYKRRAALAKQTEVSGLQNEDKDDKEETPVPDLSRSKKAKTSSVKDIKETPKSSKSGAKSKGKEPVETSKTATISKKDAKSKDLAGKSAPKSKSNGSPEKASGGKSASGAKSKRKGGRN